MRQHSSYRSKTSRRGWFVALLGTVAVTLVLARLFNRTSSPDQSVKAGRFVPPPSRPTPSTKEPRPGAGLAHSLMALAAASEHRVNGDSLPDTEPSAQDYIDRAKAEPRDDAWAGPTERLFGEDLRAKAEKYDFRVGRVECRTNTCNAELSWSSLRDARAHFEGVLGEPERVGCQPRLLLTEGANEDAPEMGVMLLHCRSQRERAARRAGVAPAEDQGET